MNELLQKHGCANVFTVPEGLKELMADITREVLRDQPSKIFDYIANYLSVLLITREHGILAVKILDDLCDCRPSVSEHLLQLGIERNQAEMLSKIIKEEVEGFEPVEGKEKIKETQILKKILTGTVLDEDMAAKVCQVARNAYRDFWYRKKLIEKNLKTHPEEPWEIAAERTLAIYKLTKPSYSELIRATEKIQAAYRGYHVRRSMLHHLKVKPNKKKGPKVNLPGPPLDVASSREIDLGPVLNVKVREDDVAGMLDKGVAQKLGIQYDPMRTLTHVEYQDMDLVPGADASRAQSRAAGLSAKSVASRSQFGKSAHSHIGQKESRLETKVSKVMSVARPPVEDEGSPRKSRHSRLPSRMPSTEGDLLKISFDEKPPEFIDADPAEVPEEIPAAHEAEAIEATEVTEAIEATKAPQTAAEGDAQEVPEDIPDDRTEADTESAPATSVPSSAPTTDVEDAAE